MYQPPTGTKLALIEAAGELFAVHGLSGTGIRAIAERAQANIAAVNYHFGSKEHLYSEVLRFVVYHDDADSAGHFLERLDTLDSDEDMARIVAAIIRAKFKVYFSQKERTWAAPFFMRSLIETPPALAEAVQDIFAPELVALKHIMKKASPNLSDVDTTFMAFSLIGQISFYVLAQAPILTLLGRDRYDDAFLEALRAHITNVTLSCLNLPVASRHP